MPPRPSRRRVPPYGFLAAVKGNLGAIAVGLKYFLDPNRFTLHYPREYIRLKPGYRGFIVLNKAKCIMCESCARICPAAAMKMVRFQAPDPRRPGKMKLYKYPVINYQRCIFCGYCVDVCPTEALRHVPAHDVVYYNLEEMDLNLEQFQVEPKSPAEVEGGIPVRYVFDPERGLVKVPEKGQAGGG
ncbi:MAG: NADH-quinone oxidoreductase subunit NuoI [Desulfurococcales archaeon]|nr:NADH-quinone oxidoreductase subunit NuoI [Desulfurococcales archaeon]